MFYDNKGGLFLNWLEFTKEQANGKLFLKNLLEDFLALPGFCPWSLSLSLSHSLFLCVFGGVDLSVQIVG